MLCQNRWLVVRRSPRQGLGAVLEQGITNQLRAADLEARQQVRRFDVELLHAVVAYQYRRTLAHQFGERSLMIGMLLRVLPGREKDAALVQPNRQRVSSGALKLGKMQNVANPPCRIAR